MTEGGYEKIYKIVTGMKRVDRDELFNFFSIVSERGGTKLRLQEPGSTHKKGTDYLCNIWDPHNAVGCKIWVQGETKHRREIH